MLLISILSLCPLHLSKILETSCQLPPGKHPCLLNTSFTNYLLKEVAFQIVQSHLFCVVIIFSNSDIFRSILFFETYRSYALTEFIDIIWAKCRNSLIYAAVPERKLHDEFRSSLKLRNTFKFL